MNRILKIDLSEHKYYTLRIENNLTDDLYLDWNLLLTFDKNKRIAIQGKRFKNITKQSALGYSKKTILEKYSELDVSKLDITMIYEEHDIEELTVYNNQTHLHYYSKPLSKDKHLRDSIRDTKNKIYELESDISDLESEKSNLEYELYELQQQFKEEIE